MNDGYFSNMDWLMKRLGRFTASEIHKLFVGPKSEGGLFGDGAETYILQKAAEICTGEVKEEVDFKQAQWAKAHEYEAIDLYQKQFGYEGEYYGAGNPQFFEFGAYGGCSPDWNGGTFGAEVKCPWNSHEHLRNRLIKSAEQLQKKRKEYYSQIQMEILVMKWEFCHFVSYDPRMLEKEKRLYVLPVYPDELWQAEFTLRMTEAIFLLKQIVKGGTPTQKPLTKRIQNLSQPSIEDTDDRPLLNL
jgi:hypothetical protein